MPSDHDAAAQADWDSAATNPPEVHRPEVANVRLEGREVPGPGGTTKTIEVAVYRRVDTTGHLLRSISGGWPKSVGGIPFVVRPSRPGAIPDAGSVRLLSRPANLFAWAGEVAELYWHQGSCFAAGGGKRSPPTKEEFYAHIQTSGDQYAAVCVLPHQPPVDGAYYLPCELPPVGRGTDGRPLTPTLDAFCAILNPDTEQDRDLLRVLVVTLFWGGGCGKRPAFVLCSEHGRGSGKTSTAEAIAALAGGHFSVGAKEEWTQVSKRLMSDRSLQVRVILIDNVKGRLGGQEIESLITSDRIEGWRPYHGDYSRPNLSTVVITSNTPALTRDLATRAVIIKIGQKRHTQSFQRTAAVFLNGLRPALIAECLALLAAPPRGAIRDANRDRFQDWQDGPLSTVPNADALAALCIDRREGVDMDGEEAASVSGAIVGWLRGKSLDPGRTHKITRDEMRDLLIKARVIDDGISKRGLHTWLGSLLGSDGPLAPLRDGPRQSDGMCWLWVGSVWAPDDSDLPPV